MTESTPKTSKSKPVQTEVLVENTVDDYPERPYEEARKR